MIPGWVSQGRWTKGVRATWSLAMEAARYASGVWIALTLVFFVFQVWPATPEYGLASHNPQFGGYVQQNVATFALDQPVWTRYGVWLSDVFTGNLGLSYYWRTPVLGLVAQFLAPTLELVAIMALWAILLGTLLGWAASSRRSRAVASASRDVGLVLYTLPLFWVLIVALVGAYEAWRVSLGMSFPPPSAFPQARGPTGFPIIDAILSGDLGLTWLVLWTTFLLALPCGAVLALPILLRTNGALRRAREVPAVRAPGGRHLRPSVLGHVVAAVAGGVAAILPLLVSSAVLTEWLSGRRGLGWLLIESLYHLDMPMFQGVLVILIFVAVAAAFPFALVGAGLVRQPASMTPSPRRALESGEVELWLRGVAQRLRESRSTRFWLGLFLAAIPLLLAVAAPALTPYGPMQRVTDTSCSTLSPPLSAMQPPCLAHPMGTDYYGYDIFSQVLYAGAFPVGASLVALLMASGIALALAMLCGVLGRTVSVTLRVALGAVATIPGLLLLLMSFLDGPYMVPAVEAALVVIFVPVLFRDAEALVSRVGSSRRPGRTGGAPGPGMADRLSASVAAVLPGFVARMPRRLAEISLLLETFSFFGLLVPPGLVDWASITLAAIYNQAFLIGNWPWLIVPGLVLFVYAVGLMLIPDGLRFVLTPEPPEPVPVPIAPAPVPTPPVPSATNP